MGESAAQGFLNELGDDAAGQLRALGARRRFPAGAWIFLEGDDASEALFLLDGMVKVVTTAFDGREVIIDLLCKDAIVGELSAIDGKQRSAAAIALSDVDLLSVPSSTFTAFLREHPAAMHQLLIAITGRLRNTVKRQLELGAGDAIGRLCSRLVELADRFGSPTAAGHLAIQSPISQSDLAAWSGLSREAIVKAMRRLRDLGWIENEGARITILRPDSLAARAVT